MDNTNYHLLIKAFQQGFYTTEQMRDVFFGPTGSNYVDGSEIIYDVSGSSQFQPVNMSQNRFLIASPERCAYCRSKWHASRFHPGVCGECGAPMED